MSKRRERDFLLYDEKPCQSVRQYRVRRAGTVPGLYLKTFQNTMYCDIIDANQAAWMEVRSDDLSVLRR